MILNDLRIRDSIRGTFGLIRAHSEKNLMILGFEAPGPPARPCMKKLGLCGKAIFKKFHTVCKKLANGEHSDRLRSRLVYEKPWLLRDFRFEGQLIRRTDSYLL